MIVLDTETTGLITNEALPLDMQPLVIEIGALKVNLAMDVEEELSLLLYRPDFRLSEKVQEITNLDDAALREGGVPPAKAIAALAEFCLGEHTLLAHNLRFDLMMIVFELRRLGQEYRFPFPRAHIDTHVLWSGRLQEWAEKYGLGTQRHRALDDAKLLLECYRRHIAETEGKWSR